MAQADLLVPGLNKPLTSQDFVEARWLYNNHREEPEVPDITAHLTTLAELFCRHKGVAGTFGVHLAHRHGAIPGNVALVGYNIERPHARWLKPTDAKDLPSTAIHGHVFSLTAAGGLHPYEFQEGPAPDLSRINNVSLFLREFTTYIIEHNLAAFVALEILDHHDDRDADQPMVEVVFAEGGTIMLDASNLCGFEPGRQTGWTFGIDNGKPAILTAGLEYHGRRPNGNHDIVKSGTPFHTESDILKFLRDRGILKGE